jgi:hypothetical protein
MNGNINGNINDKWESSDRKSWQFIPFISGIQWNVTGICKKNIGMKQLGV